MPLDAKGRTKRAQKETKVAAKHRKAQITLGMRHCEMPLLNQSPADAVIQSQQQAAHILR